MAAIQLPAPGTEHGPCEDLCHHTDCKAVRRMARDVCRFCGEAIGFDTRFYSDPDDQNQSVHAVCLEGQYEATA